MNIKKLLIEAWEMMEQVDKVHRKFHDYGPDEVKIFQVDGVSIRNNIMVDFIGGGHHLVYDFIPENEIWIEYSHGPDEQRMILAHELVEHLLMKHKGIKYNEAHNKANNVEAKLRSGEEPEEVFSEFCHENFKKPELQNMGKQLTLAYLSY